LFFERCITLLTLAPLPCNKLKRASERAGAAAFVSMAGEGAFARIAGAAAFDIILGERASFLVERDFHPLHVFISLCPFQLSTCFFFAPPPHPLQPPAYNRLSCSSFTSLSTIMVVWQWSQQVPSEPGDAVASSAATPPLLLMLLLLLLQAAVLLTKRRISSGDVPKRRAVAAAVGW